MFDGRIDNVRIYSRALTAAGYAVTLPHHVDRELGVLIVSEAAPFEYDFYRDLTRYHTPTPSPT